MSIFYTDPSFAARLNGDVFHGFFSRRGGKSAAPYNSLNCGIGSDDDPHKVAANRAIVAATAGVDGDALLSVFQVHGADVIHVGAKWNERPKADAMVTDHPNIALGILTADCTPVLFSGQKADGSMVVGAAHAGWKGALGGVLDNVVLKMVAMGAVQNTVQACVGPCISKASYEVTHEFANPFLDENDESERFFYDGSKQGHLFFDLSGYCAWRLFRAQVKNISIMDMDTYKNEDDFFSYRRATHRNTQEYGRQISVIGIKS